LAALNHDQQMTQSLKKPILILKTGRTFREISSVRGDFEDWIMKGAGLGPEQIIIVEVSAGEPLPEHFEFSGIIISGSHAMVTEKLDWSERTAHWISQAVARNIPMLGICYGHQLLAHALGGHVDFNSRGLESGTVLIHLNPDASKDPLFSCLPVEVYFHVSHSQSASALPPGAVLLASNEAEPHHGFRFGDCVWGVQFHPEFDADLMHRYLIAMADRLTAAGQNVEALIRDCTEAPHGPVFLRRFISLVLKFQDQIPAS